MKTDVCIQEIVDHCGSWVTEKCCEASIGRMTSDLFPYDRLFSPIRINKLTVKNRIVMAPMGNIDMCEETGRPNDKMLQYFFARAKGGAGLLTTGLVPVSHGLDHTVSENGNLSYFPRIDRSRTVQSGWRDLAQGVHAFGSRIFIQLTPGLGRVGNPQCLVNKGKFPQSASRNPNFYIPEIPCFPISDRKLKKIIQNAGQAAADAKACGLDGVYLHGHEGYHLEQMTNPAFNRRKLGRYANVKNFGLDLIREIRRRVGPDYPVMYRIDLSLALNETYGETMNVKALKKFQNGRSVTDTLMYMDALVTAGVDIFDVDLGCYDNWWLPHPPAGMPAGCFLKVSELVKEHFEKSGVISNAGLPIPVVAVGKLGYPDLAEKALRENQCDMIMLGRPLLADPEWPNKAFAGKVSEICPCIGCQEGCINEFVEGGHPQCAVNPRTGFEDVYSEILPKTDRRKYIAVIGAGPAGINFALTATECGHSVDLYEGSGDVGGKMVSGSVPRFKFDLDNYRLYCKDRLQKAIKSGKIALIPDQADAALIKSRGYDVVVSAIGTRSTMPAIDGLSESGAIRAEELLLHPEKLGDAKKIVVIGGGVVGCETAYWLSYEKSCDVDIVEQLPTFMTGTCTANRGHLIHYLEKNGVRLHNATKVKEVESGSVHISRNIGKNVPDPYNTWQPLLPENIENPLAKTIQEHWKAETLDCDLVVVATGGKADDRLFYDFIKSRVAPEIYNIGDSFAAGRILEANRAAYHLALKI